MSKRFDIHEWQAKQRLAENDDYQKRQDAQTPGKNPDAFYGDGSLDKLRKSNAKNAKKDVAESLNPEVSRALDRFIRTMADKYDYSMQDAVYAIMAALKQRNYDGLGEASMTGTDNLEGIKKGKMVHLNQYFEDIGKMKLGDGTIDIGYAKIDLVPGNLEEMSATGTGASFNAGAGEGYMTPNAFKKKRKDD
jgi:hypothetical protein